MRAVIFIVVVLTITSAGPAHAYRGVVLKKSSATKEGFGTVFVGTFTIKNENAYAVKDIEITCEHYGRRGMKLSTTSKTIHDALKAGQTRTFRDVNVGFISDQAERYSCEISGFIKQ